MKDLHARSPQVRQRFLYGLLAAVALCVAAVPAARFKDVHLIGSDNRLSGSGGKLTADAGTTVDLAAATVLLPGGTGASGGGGTSGLLGQAHFSGTGSVSGLAKAGIVSAVTRTGTGTYHVDLTGSPALYTVAVLCHDDATSPMTVFFTGNRDAAGFNFVTYNTQGPASRDSGNIDVSIFGSMGSGGTPTLLTGTWSSSFAGYSGFELSRLYDSNLTTSFISQCPDASEDAATLTFDGPKRITSFRIAPHNGAEARSANLKIQASTAADPTTWVTLAQFGASPAAGYTDFPVNDATLYKRARFLNQTGGGSSPLSLGEAQVNGY